jgi:hypothetical protein
MHFTLSNMLNKLLLQRQRMLNYNNVSFLYYDRYCESIYLKYSAAFINANIVI